jgi:hypothetical protein
MRKISPIYIFLCLAQTLFGQTNIEKIWTTLYLNDSIIIEKYYSKCEYDFKNAHYEISFDQDGDTNEMFITYSDINGNDSLQIWKFPNECIASAYTTYWIYDSNHLIMKFTTMDKKFNRDTVLYKYNNLGNCVKRTFLGIMSHPFDTLIYANTLLCEIISYSPSEIRETVKYKYNKNKQPKIIITYNSDGKEIEKTQYKYDSQNRTLGYKTTGYWYFKKKIQTLRIQRYKYFENGNLQELFIQDFRDDYILNKFYNTDGTWMKTIDIDTKNFEKRVLEPQS